MPQLNIKDFHLQHKFFSEIGGMTNYEIEQIAKKYEYARQTDSGIPVLGMLRAVNEERRKLTETFGSNLSKDMDEAKLEYELKQENILSKRILNQAKLGVLIPKEEAEERMKKTLRGVMNVIKNVIKNISPRLINIPSARDAEQMLTKEWNEAVKVLEENSQVISWAADGSSKLLKTRLIDIEKEDPEFADVVKLRSFEKDEEENENQS